MSKAGFAAVMTVAFIFLAWSLFAIATAKAGFVEYGYVAIFLISAIWARLQFIRQKRAKN